MAVIMPNPKDDRKLALRISSLGNQPVTWCGSTSPAYLNFNHVVNGCLIKHHFKARYIEIYILNIVNLVCVFRISAKQTHV